MVTMSDCLISVDDVSKKFCRSLRKSLLYGLRDIGRELSVRPPASRSELRRDEFWAVKGISFMLRRGECLGLIGGNGAGKSTLLKMLNGLIKPDAGRIEMRGRVGALIELGTGFNPILSGRENVYVNGSILGFTKAEIKRKFDDIVDFSGLHEFIEMPVQSYSSGMKVRLGFSVAAQMEPDILLIDEVLAVGDVGFRARCFNAINAMQSKAAIIFVSHAMPHVARLCDSILLLERGETRYHGRDVPRGIEEYYSAFGHEKGVVSGSGRADLLSIQLRSDDRSETPGDRLVLNYSRDLTIELVLKADRTIPALNVNLSFFDKELRAVAQAYSINGDFRLVNDKDIISVQARIPEVLLNPGVYNLSVVLTDERRGETLVNCHAIKEFQVHGAFIGFAPIQLKGIWTRTDS
jgi:lipopolysaccharide transport system ATP-binding protein